jgi:hypothetical protein
LRVRTIAILVLLTLFTFTFGFKTIGSASTQLQVVCTSMGEPMVMTVEVESDGSQTIKACHECLFCALHAVNFFLPQTFIKINFVRYQYNEAKNDFVRHQFYSSYQSARGPPSFL